MNPRQHKRQEPPLTSALPPERTRPERLLGPGEVCLLRRGESVQTLLGSCVAIVLTDPARTLAAVCHFVHAGPCRLGASDTSHAEAALRSLCALLRGQGMNPGFCQAYVYGGANMFPGIFAGGHVGETNSRWALQALAELGIQVVGCDVGGLAYRRLQWRVGPAAPRISLGESAERGPS